MPERPLFDLPQVPTRAQLRGAIAALAPLARCGLPGAMEELTALERLVREMFPRRAAERRGPSPRKRRRKRRLIDRVDCKATCHRCAGTGICRLRHDAGDRSSSLDSQRAEARRRIDAWRGPSTAQMLGTARPGALSGRNLIGRLEARMIDDRRVRLVAPSSDRATGRARRGEVTTVNAPCPHCDGRGEVALGTSAHPLAPGQLGNVSEVCTWWRGEPVAPRTRQTVQPARPVSGVHRRGHVAGVQVGDESGDESGGWCTQHLPGDGASPIDRSAESEARAIRAMRRTDTLERPRGKRHLVRRDPTILTARQERRAKMQRRVDRYNAEWRRANRDRSIWWARRSSLPDARALLQRMGIDVDSIIGDLSALPPTPVAECPIVAEARRRGDLSPDDAPQLDRSRAPLDWIDQQWIEKRDVRALMRLPL